MSTLIAFASADRRASPQQDAAMTRQREQPQDDACA